MATASVNHMVLWTDLEGTEFNGRWQLVRQVRSEGRTGWFEAMASDNKRVMLIITETLNDEDELLERLRSAEAIRHPNVVAIEESLVARLDDTPMVIAVTEFTEENLGDVLRERALGSEEARQVMDALLAGLAAVHGRGLVHGRMEAASVLATGETIKLRSDCVHEGGEGFAVAAGEDVRGVARIVVQALTRRIPMGDNDPVLQLVPEPLARAARRALSGRATVEEIATLAGIRIVPSPQPSAAAKITPAERVRSEAPAPAAKPAVIERTLPDNKEESEPALAPLPTSATKAAEGVAAPKPPETPSAAVTVAEPAPAKPLRAPAVAAKPNAEEPIPANRESDLLLEDEEPEWNRRSAAPWIVIAAAALVIITAFVLYGMLHRSPAKQATAAAPPVVTSAQVRHSPPASQVAAERSPESANVTAAPGAGWRVVAYTYNHQNQAEQKARSLANRYPQLQAGVFAPKGRETWLVTLGGVMSTRAAAVAVREQALRLGLPRDTYARNFR